MDRLSKSDRIQNEMQRHRAGKAWSIPAVSKQISILANHYENYFDVLEEIFIKDSSSIPQSRQLSFHMSLMNQLMTTSRTLESFRRIKSFKNKEVLHRLYRASSVSVEGIILMLENYPEIKTLYELHSQIMHYPTYNLSYHNTFTSIYDSRSEELKKVIFEYQKLLPLSGADLFATSIALSLANVHQNDTDMTEIFVRAISEGYELDGAKVFRFFHSWSQVKHLPLDWINSLTSNFKHSELTALE